MKPTEVETRLWVGDAHSVTRCGSALVLLRCATGHAPSLHRRSWIETAGNRACGDAAGATTEGGSVTARFLKFLG